METINQQYTDPQVTHNKFEEQVQIFYSNYIEWSKKGVFLIRNEFPKLEFIFTTPKLKPSSLVFAVCIDFTNYDTEPASIKFINPFTKELLARKNIPIGFIQASFPNNTPNPDIPIQLQVQQRDLLQAYTVEEMPFFCMQGVREYHDNPAHTGDSWFLYRGEGIGNLNYLLDQLYNHSIQGIVSHKVELQPVIGFNQQVTIQANQ